MKQGRDILLVLTYDIYLEAISLLNQLFEISTWLTKVSISLIQAEIVLSVTMRKYAIHIDDNIR